MMTWQQMIMCKDEDPKLKLTIDDEDGGQDRDE